MRPTKKHMANQRYRVINNRTKIIVLSKDRPLLKPASKIFSSTKLQQGDTYENDMTVCSDMESTSEEELDQVNNKIPTINSLKSTLRPLLELFSEDSSPTKPEKAVDPLKPQTPQVTYKNISLSTSDEEEFLDEEQQTLSLKIDALSSLKVTPNRCERVISSKEGIAPYTRARRFKWTPKTTNIFLDLWEKHLNAFRGKTPKSHIYREMAREMITYGPTYKEIKHKMDNMSKKYKMEATKDKSGNPSNWQYLERLQFLLTESTGGFFEETIVEKTDSTNNFNAASSDQSDNFSDAENYIPKTRMQKSNPMESVEKAAIEDDEVEETDHEHEQELNDEPHHIPQELKYKTKERTDLEAGRFLQIEEEKLVIEKQKLRVMEHISRELSSISKALSEFLRNSKK